MSGTARNCRRCGQPKPWPDGFTKHPRYAGGVSNCCHDCKRAAIRAQRATVTRAPERRRQRKSEEQREREAIAREEKRIAEANERALQKLIPIEWPLTKART